MSVIVLHQICIPGCFLNLSFFLTVCFFTVLLLIGVKALCTPVSTRYPVKHYNLHCNSVFSPSESFQRSENDQANAPPWISSFLLKLLIFTLVSSHNIQNTINSFTILHEGSLCVSSEAVFAFIMSLLMSWRVIEVEECKKNICSYFYMKQEAWLLFYRTLLFFS